MTASQTEIAEVLTRLQRIEERQNLLKNNLLSLKQQVNTLQAAFEDRPEQEQLQQIQAQLDVLDTFGDRLPQDKSFNLDSIGNISSSSTESDYDHDADLLSMPTSDDDLDIDIDIDAELEDALGANLSSLTDELDDVDLDSFEFDDLNSTNPSSADTMDDLAFDMELNRVADFGDGENLGELNSSGTAIHVTDNEFDFSAADMPNDYDDIDDLDDLGDLDDFGDMAEMGAIATDNLELDDDIELDGIDSNNFGDLGDTGESSDITEADLPSLSDLGAFDDITEEEMALLGDMSETGLSALETGPFDDFSDLDLDGEMAEMPLDNPEAPAAEGLAELTPASDSSSTSGDDLDMEALMFMEDDDDAAGNLSITDIEEDFNTDIDDLVAASDLSNTLPEPSEFNALIPVLSFGNSLEDVDLDIDNLESELAADMSDYDGMDDFPETEDASALENPSEFSEQAEAEFDMDEMSEDDLDLELNGFDSAPGTFDLSDYDGMDDLSGTEGGLTLDNTPEFSEQAEAEFDMDEMSEDDLDFAESDYSSETFETMEETGSIEGTELSEEIGVTEEVEAIAPSPDLLDEDEHLKTEPKPAIVAPAEHSPIIDTEAPEELAAAIASPEEPASISAELSAEDILSRIENRQHYFIGFRLPQLNLTQQNLRDCIFDQSNLEAGNFQSSDLRDTSFKGCNLQGSNLQFTSLERANFEKANLQNVNFQGILFNNRTNFQEANLQEADFSGLDFSKTPIFTHANLHRTKFIGVNLRGLNLGRWDLTAAKLCRANLISTNLKEAILTDADLTGAVYSDTTIFPENFDPEAAGALNLKEGANLAGANLQGLDLNRLNLKAIDFQGANLEHTNLNACDLSKSNFAGANLRRSQLRAICIEANFQDANLSQTDLTETEATGSNFQNANFQGAILKNANFVGTDLRNAQFKGSNTYRTDCCNANLSGIDLRGANFEGELRGANLTGAKLQDLNLNYLDLSEADLSGADVTGATFRETNLDKANLTNVTGLTWESYDYPVYLNGAILPDGSQKEL